VPSSGNQVGHSKLHKKTLSSAGGTQQLDRVVGQNPS